MDEHHGPGLTDSQKQNILFALEKAALLADGIKRSISEPWDQIDLCASEIAVTALVEADLLEETQGIESLLMRGEIVRCLRQLASCCFDIQETDRGHELLSLARMLETVCRRIADLADLPMPNTTAARDTLASPVPHSGTEGPFGALQVTPEAESDVQRLRAELRALRDLLTSLVVERDHLKNVVLRDIEAAYMRELGGLEAELYRAESEVRLLKAKAEILQAGLNRQEPIREEDADGTLRDQFEEYRRVYEEFIRRVFEANRYSEQRKRQEERRRKKAEDGAETSDNDPHTSGESEAAPDQDAGSEEQKLKLLYRKIAKAMHPDLHPDQDEETRQLFKKATMAYREGDLRTLREIAAILEAEAPETGEALLEALQREKTRLLALIREVRAELRFIRNRYPYTKKTLLEDPVRLAAEKDRLNARLAAARKAAEVYRNRIGEITRENEQYE